MTTPHSNRKRLRDFARETRGAAMTEYVVLIGAVGLAVAVCIVAIGPKLVRDFEASRAMIVAPTP
jgi:Flp pilus assembly pilin Flp